MNKEEQIPDAIEPDGLNSELFPDRNGKMVPFIGLLNPDAQTPDDLIDDCVKDALRQVRVMKGKGKFLDYSVEAMSFAETHCAGMAEAVVKLISDFGAMLNRKMEIEQESAANANEPATPTTDEAQDGRAFLDSAVPWPDGKNPAPIYSNFKKVMYWTGLGVGLQFDTITHKYRFPQYVYKTNWDISARNSNFVLDIDEACRNNGLRVPEKKLNSFIHRYATEHAYNGAVEHYEDCLSEFPDAAGELDEILSCFVFADGVSDDEQEMYFQLITKWFVQCVAMAHNGDRVVDGKIYGAEFVLTLQSEKKGIGKTSFFRNWAQGFPDGYYIEGLSIDAKNKDDRIRACSTHICELGELESTTKKGYPELKNFVTVGEDTVRAPYATCDERYVRHLSPAATVNRPDFLPEPDRRFVIVPVVDFNLHHFATVNMRKAHAEACRLFHEGLEADTTGRQLYFRLTKEEREFVERVSRKHQVRTPEVQALEDSLRWDDPITEWRYATASEIAVDIGLKPERAAAVARALRGAFGYSLSKETPSQTREDSYIKGRCFHYRGNIARYWVPEVGTGGDEEITPPTYNAGKIRTFGFVK